MPLSRALTTEFKLKLLAQTKIVFTFKIKSFEIETQPRKETLELQSKSVKQKIRIKINTGTLALWAGRSGLLALAGMIVLHYTMPN